MYCLKILTFIKFPIKEKAFFTEAFFTLGVSRLAILLMPFNNLVQYVERTIKNIRIPENRDAEEIIKHVKWSIGLACKYTPWQSKCFAQALAAQIMLRRRRIASTIYFGVTKENENTLAAHAWLKSGDKIITGGQYRDKFSPMTRIG